MEHTAIVIVAFNRPCSLKRLLASLERGQYGGQRVPLVISIDYADSSENQEVAALAGRFVWPHGEKRVIRHEENLGLKRHVLSCGDLTQEYGSIMMLEDDLFVSPWFYSFGVKALSFSEDKDYIGGISLYNHLFNVHAREPFEALADGYDNWYFQFASSWGQAYTRRQWQGFREWLLVHGSEAAAGQGIPENVSSWSDKSWLKYAIKYLVDSGRFFLYPRVSYTTNFFDEGTHSDRIQNDLQVPLQLGQVRAFSFSGLTQSAAVYDAFFENMRLLEAARLPAGTVVDLYGMKKAEGAYLLTSKSLPRKRLRSYGLRLRPLEANILMDQAGDSFFLYDLGQPGRPPAVREGKRILYHFRGFKAAKIKPVLAERIAERLHKTKTKNKTR